MGPFPFDVEIPDEDIQEILDAVEAYEEQAPAPAHFYGGDEWFRHDFAYKACGRKSRTQANTWRVYREAGKGVEAFFVCGKYTTIAKDDLGIGRPDLVFYPQILNRSPGPRSGVWLTPQEHDDLLQEKAAQEAIKAEQAAVEAARAKYR